MAPPHVTRIVAQNTRPSFRGSGNETSSRGCEAGSWIKLWNAALDLRTHHTEGLQALSRMFVTSSTGVCCVRRLRVTSTWSLLTICGECIYMTLDWTERIFDSVELVLPKLVGGDVKFVYKFRKLFLDPFWSVVCIVFCVSNCFLVMLGPSLLYIIMPTRRAISMSLESSMCMSGRATLLNLCVCGDDAEDQLQVHGWLLGLYLMGFYRHLQISGCLPWSLTEVEQSMLCCKCNMKFSMNHVCVCIPTGSWKINWTFRDFTNLQVKGLEWLEKKKAKAAPPTHLIRWEVKQDLACSSKILKLTSPNWGVQGSRPNYGFPLWMRHPRACTLHKHFQTCKV